VTLVDDDLHLISACHVTLTDPQRQLLSTLRERQQTANLTPA
jgi:hypothetical protein